ncbi:helicase-related protein [Thermus caliditerrae]|uniref:helicase-related protein n=1 Tax=Thermus caliditerrae TaxID=1330700 RepID=UPI001F43370D|nr:helicase-related protein [Thermus caliditerrae]
MWAPLHLPDFIDNERLKLAEALAQLLRHQRQADFASGYFNLGGFALVQEALWLVPRFRLLLSKEQGAGGGELYPAGFRRELERAQLNVQNRELARELVRFLQRPEVEVRLYTKGFFHGKAYIFNDVAIIGSSNFTQAGLTSNTELNSVHKQGYAVQAAREWFERFWTQSEDFKHGLIQLLEESKLISSVYSPYLIFIKSLYEYFKDELTVDLDKGRDVGKSLVDLADFQEKAFERALRILQKYDGVFIADSVGLGKTWIGKRLLEHFGYFQRKRCLVIAPAQLREMWEKELASIQVAAHVESMERLGRKDFDPSQYFDVDVVLVDESHNFRNSNQRYDALSQIMAAGRRKKAILLTATPINNSVFDLYNQVMLFAQDDRYFARAGIPHLRSYFVRASLDGDVLNLLEEVMIRRTRQFIKREFPEAVINGERIRFPERRLHTVRYSLEALAPGLYEQIALLFEKLELAAYNPERFLKSPTPEEEEKVLRNEALISLMKTILLKRFESSAEAFRRSLDRYIGFHERFIEELMRGRLLSAGDYRRLLDLEGEDSDEEVQAFLQKLPSVAASSYKALELAQAAAEDLEALRKMRGLVEPIKTESDPKIAELVALIRQHAGRKILVFSYFQDTIRYIEKAFRGAYAHDLARWRWEVVDGSVDPKRRAEIIQRFAPKAQRAKVPPEKELDLLLATDVFSEGQNLQDADTLINFDLHWNPVRMVQRAGRIDRLGSPFEVIHIYNFFPEEGLEAMLGLLERLWDKILQIDKNVGLDASVLGEAVNPKTFNALRRIEREDAGVADELEAEAEISSEFMRLVLSSFLQKIGAERIEAIPYGAHSGLAGRERKGVFFHFKVGDEHIWRFYDVETGSFLDSKHRIFQLIQCDETTPRVDADYEVDALLEMAKKELLEELNAQHAETLRELPKVQRELKALLWGLDHHPQVDRNDLLEVMGALKEPLPRVLLKELRDIQDKYRGRDVELVEALKEFARRYRLDQKDNEPRQAKTFTEEDLELVVYLTLA